MKQINRIRESIYSALDKDGEDDFYTEELVEQMFEETPVSLANLYVAPKPRWRFLRFPRWS